MVTEIKHCKNSITKGSYVWVDVMGAEDSVAVACLFKKGVPNINPIFYLNVTSKLHNRF